MLCITKSLVLKPTVLSLCFVLLSACSSGGGKNKNNPPPTDTSPDAVTFNLPSGADLNKVALNSTVISNPVTISGINTATAISIVGGTYAIGAGEFTDKPSTINNGDLLKVKLVTGTKAGETTSATLTLGGVIAKFTVKTQPDDHKRELTVLFPPPNFMTEGADVLVRGKVVDLDGTLTEDGVLVVDGKPIKLTLNPNRTEGTWETRAALIAAAQGNFLVESQDQLAGPTLKQSISYKQVGDIANEFFPDNNVPFGDIQWTDLGLLDKKLTLFLVDSLNRVLTIDLATGFRTVLADNTNVTDPLLQFKSMRGVSFADNGKLYVTDSNKIYELDLANKERRVIAKGGGDSFVNTPRGLWLEQKSDDQVLLWAVNNIVYSIDLSSGSQNLLTKFEDEVNRITVGQALLNDGNRFLVAGGDYITAVDKATGARTHLTPKQELTTYFKKLIKSGLSQDIYVYKESGGVETINLIELNSYKETVFAASDDKRVNKIIRPSGIASYNNLGHLEITDLVSRAIFSMDYKTGERVVVSKSYTPPVTE